MSIRDLLRQSRPSVKAVEISVGTVYVRGMSGEVRAKYMAMAKDAQPATHAMAALGLCEEDGRLCYESHNPHHLEELQEVRADDLDKIVLALFEASGLGKKSEEDAAKKSEASPSESGGTGSQEISAAP